jgi:hypothetical protein
MNSRTLLVLAALLAAPLTAATVSGCADAMAEKPGRSGHTKAKANQSANQGGRQVEFITDGLHLEPGTGAADLKVPKVSDQGQDAQCTTLFIDNGGSTASNWRTVCKGTTSGKHCPDEAKVEDAVTGKCYDCDLRLCDSSSSEDSCDCEALNCEETAGGVCQ